jgi:predicted RNA methylase
MTTVSAGTADARVLRGFLHDLGYGDDFVKEDFPVWLGDRIVRADLVAFGRPAPRDMTTATIVAESLGHEQQLTQVIEIARALACPAAVIATSEGLQLWSISAHPGEEQRIDSVPTAEAQQLAGRFRDDLAPANLLSAKSSGRQLSLFPLDVSLLTSSRIASSERLSGRVEQAMKHALATSRFDQADKEKRVAEASRTVIGTLAALVVRDKFELDAHGLSIFDAARQTFRSYFEWLELDDIGDLDRERLSRLIGILDEGITYEGLDPRVVSEVYENAIVSRATRLQLGVFYTPPELARRMVSHIPFEELPPDDRVVLDPACGSGTLLLAAHDRLQDLAPIRWDPTDKHRYLVSHLSGWDVDPFAVEIARLSLLLHALPAGNSWNIEQRDARDVVLAKPRPTIVLSNPPWRYERRGGARRQLADDFLLSMLRHVKPGGFVAAILPAGWLSSGTSRAARERLQEQADLFEVWRLPDRVFGTAENAPCIVFAQATQSTGRPWVFRRILSKDGLDRFYETGVADEWMLAKRSQALRQGTLLRGPLDQARDVLAALPRLRSIATVKSGLAPRPPVAAQANEGEFLWLRHAKNLPSFGAVREQGLRRARFPEDFAFGGTYNADLLRRHKVLVSASRAERNPWRLKAGVDLLGVIPSNTMHMVLPSGEHEDDLYALLAILGSWIAAVWIDSYDTKRAVEAALLRNLPVPPRDIVWHQLAALGRELVEAPPGELSGVTRRVDQLVAQAYRLPESVVKQLERHFGGFVAPEGSVRYPASEPLDIPTGIETRRFGAVYAVEGDVLRVWVPGVTEEDGQPIPVPNRFLGWHCVAEATFEVSSVNADLQSGRYYFQARSYQELDELLPSRNVEVAS